MHVYSFIYVFPVSLMGPSKIVVGPVTKKLFLIEFGPVESDSQLSMESMQFEAERLCLLFWEISLFSFLLRVKSEY